MQTDDLKAAAAEILTMRRRREQVLSTKLIGEPGWDMLLAAYSASEEIIQAKELCFSSNVPESTAFRWIQVLEQQGFIQRTAHPTRQDQRATFYKLTQSGRFNVAHALEVMLRD